jgi:hypothetical protein
MFKNLENMLNNFTGVNSSGSFNFKLIKKYVIIVGISVFLSGFGLGILVGLLF